MGRDAARRGLVLIHGAGGNHRLWAGVLRLLREAAVPALAVDLPGHGRSPGPARSTLPGYADDIRRFVHHRRLQSWAAVGHSMGGAVALTLARQGADGLLGLGLVSTGARLPVDPAILRGTHDDFSRTCERLARFCFARGAAPEMVRLGAATLQEAGPETLHADLSACARFGLAAGELAEIALPTAVVCGADDVLTPLELSQELATGLPGATLDVLPGCGHTPLMEQPAAVANILRDLWARLPR